MVYLPTVTPKKQPTVGKYTSPMDGMGCPSSIIDGSWYHNDSMGGIPGSPSVDHWKLKDTFLEGWEIWNLNGQVPSSKLTWQWKSTFSNREYIFKWWIFHCYVSLLEGTKTAWVAFHQPIWQLWSSKWESYPKLGMNKKTWLKPENLEKFRPFFPESTQQLSYCLVLPWKSPNRPLR